MYSVTSVDDGASDREQLILKHLPQVRLIARRIHERLPEGVVLEDLISTGVIGLIAAIDNYDPSLNVQLNTGGTQPVAFDHCIVATGSRPATIPLFDAKSPWVLEARVGREIL